MLELGRYGFACHLLAKESWVIYLTRVSVVIHTMGKIVSILRALGGRLNHKLSTVLNAYRC